MKINVCTSRCGIERFYSCCLGSRDWRQKRDQSVSWDQRVKPVWLISAAGRSSQLCPSAALHPLGEVKAGTSLPAPWVREVGVGCLKNNVINFSPPSTPAWVDVWGRWEGKGTPHSTLQSTPSLHTVDASFDCQPAQHLSISFLSVISE